MMKRGCENGTLIVMIMMMMMMLAVVDGDYDDAYIGDDDDRNHPVE